jgi:hypothetical protein
MRQQRRFYWLSITVLSSLAAILGSLWGGKQFAKVDPSTA